MQGKCNVNRKATIVKYNLLAQQPRNFDSIRVASHEVILLYPPEDLNNISTEC